MNPAVEIAAIAACTIAFLAFVGGVLWRASKSLAEVLHHDGMPDCKRPAGGVSHYPTPNFSTAVPTQEQRYMSLELALEKNTAALNALNETLGKAKLQAHPEQPSKAATKAQAEPAPAKVPTPEAIAANAAAEAAKAVAAAAAPDYEKVVNPLILKCAQVTTKPTAISILGTFTSAAGTPCSNGKHVKPEDYSALMVKLNAAIDAASSSNDTLV